MSGLFLLSAQGVIASAVRGLASGEGVRVCCGAGLYRGRGARKGQLYEAALGGEVGVVARGLLGVGGAAADAASTRVRRGRGGEQFLDCFSDFANARSRKSKNRVR